MHEHRDQIAPLLMSFLGLTTMARKKRASATKSSESVRKSSPGSWGKNSRIAVFTKNIRNARATITNEVCLLMYQA